MIGAAYDVSQSRIPLKQIPQMLTTPNKFYTENLTTVLKPYGLYLKNVEYEEHVWIEANKIIVEFLIVYYF